MTSVIRQTVIFIHCDIKGITIMDKKIPKPHSIYFIIRLLFFYLLSLFTFQKVYAVQIHHTTRCICKCKAYTHVPLNAIYIESPFTNISSCICTKVVLPKIKAEIPDPSSYCLNCQCKFETRSILIIQIAVAIVIMVTYGLVTYAMFLVCLQPIINKPIHVSKQRNMDALSQEYQGITDGYQSFEVYHSLGLQEEDLSPTPFQSRCAIEETIRKLKNKQARWNQQLEIQRSKIYN